MPLAMDLTRLRFVRNPIVPFPPFNGLTVGNTIFLRLRGRVGVTFIAHELVHVEQYQRLGFIRFVRTYLSQFRRYGYHRAPLEIEANERQHLPHFQALAREAIELHKLA